MARAARAGADSMGPRERAPGRLSAGALDRRDGGRLRIRRAVHATGYGPARADPHLGSAAHRGFRGAAGTGRLWRSQSVVAAAGSRLLGAVVSQLPEIPAVAALPAHDARAVAALARRAGVRHPEPRALAD